jgi:hypothetical protein
MFFRNGTNRDVDLTVAFPLPEIDGGAAANIPINIPSTDATNFVDFHATVDGRPIQAMTEVRAFFYGSEITYELRSLGLPFSVLDKNVTAKFNGLPVENRQELERRGWIDCSLSRDGRCWPLWQTRVQFYWTEHFKAHSKVEVLHTYRPVVGGSYITMNDTGESNIAPYCGGVAAIDQIKRLKAQHPPKGPSETAVMEKTISYILTTANNWKGPIRKFRLSVVPDSQEDIVLTCMAGLKPITQYLYRLDKLNFRPDRELDLLILEPVNRQLLNP